MRPATAPSRPALALALLVPAPTLGALMALWIAPGTVGSFVYTASKVWIVLVPVLWAVMERTRRNARPDPGTAIPGPSRGGGLLVGAALGLAIGVGVAAVYWVLRGQIDPEPLRAVATKAGFGTARQYLLLGVYLALVNSLIEEFVWRWFVFRACEAALKRTGRLGGWTAVIAAALMFTAHHIVILLAYFPVWLALLASAGVFIGGVAWSWCFLRYRTIWPGYVSHAIVDIALLAIGWRLLGL